jgi:chromate reductase, NAD(P)H dehydrogenase (quinone)
VAFKTEIAALTLTLRPIPALDVPLSIDISSYDDIDNLQLVQLCCTGCNRVNLQARTMIKILAISGSLRSNSSNTTLLRAISALAPDRIQISIYEGIGNLPHFNPELDGEIPLPSVRDWRNQLKQADGIIFCTPEYAHGVPGVLKNALDWIVSSGEFMHKPTAVISASPAPDGGAKANASLVQTLKVMMAQIEPKAILCLPAILAKLTASGRINDPDTISSLQLLLSTLIETIARRSA